MPPPGPPDRPPASTAIFGTLFPSAATGGRPSFEEVAAWARTPEARLGRKVDHRILYATAAAAIFVVAAWALARWKWTGFAEIAHPEQTEPRATQTSPTATTSAEARGPEV